MSTVKSRLRVVRASQINANIYRYSFDLLIAAVIGIILSRLSGMSLTYGLIPFSVFALLFLVYEFRNWNLVKVVQNNYEVLDERLSTALESEPGNPIAESLIEEVTEDVDQVSDAIFLDPKSIGARMLVFFALAMILLTAGFLGSYLAQLQDLDDPFSGLKGLKGEVEQGYETLKGGRWDNSSQETKEQEKLGTEVGGDRPGYAEGDIPGTGGGVGGESLEDIYGQSSSASLVGQDVDFELKPEYGGSIEIRQDDGGDSIDRAYTLGEIESVESCRDCQVGPEHEELVRRYFKKITET